MIGSIACSTYDLSHCYVLSVSFLGDILVDANTSTWSEVASMTSCLVSGRWNIVLVMMRSFIALIWRSCCPLLFARLCIRTTLQAWYSFPTLAFKLPVIFHIDVICHRRGTDQGSILHVSIESWRVTRRSIWSFGGWIFFGTTYDLRANPTLSS